MAAVPSLLALGAALLLAAGVRASKYSREANEGLAAAGAKRREAGEFRVVKLNQVWEKAQRVSEAAREERGRWRPSEGVLWQSSEGSQRRAWPLRTLIPCQPPQEMGCGGGRSLQESVGAGELCAEKPRLSGPASPRQARVGVGPLGCGGFCLATPERQLRAGPTQPRSLGLSQAAGNSGAV